MNIAIYSRKSKYTGKGDSIDNQIQMCKDYAKAHYRDKELNFEVFEDEGFTGKHTNRPQFKLLLQNIKKKNYDVLICYRLDRISRNVADFSKTLELLQGYNCDFVSISEQFDTSTPMGRAMIYIASVFAQLERETIAERVRDNMVELAKSGKWSGGRYPLGFTAESSEVINDDGKAISVSTLVPVPEDQELVKLIYDTYLREKSLHKTEVWFTQNNIKSPSGILLEKTTLKVILQNPVYVKSNEEVINYLSSTGWNVYGSSDGIHGLLSYNKTQSVTRNGKSTKVLQPKENWIASMSSCVGIIEADKWLAVQKQFDTNKDLFPRLGKNNTALLTGKFRCKKCSSYMLVTHGRVSKKTGEKLFYYKCSLKNKSKKVLCDCKNVKANEIELAILNELEKLGKNKEKFIESLKAKYNSKSISNDLKKKEIKLNKTIHENKNLIDGLINKLAISDDIADILIEKIKTLKEENKRLELELVNLNLRKDESKVENNNLDLVCELLDKCSNIKERPMEEQKAIISILIDRIEWDGENCSVDFINAKKK